MLQGIPTHQLNVLCILCTDIPTYSNLLLSTNNDTQYCIPLPRVDCSSSHSLTVFQLVTNRTPHACVSPQCVLLQVVAPCTGKMVYDVFTEESSCSSSVSYTQLESRLSHIQPVEILYPEGISGGLEDALIEWKRLRLGACRTARVIILAVGTPCSACRGYRFLFHDGMD